MSAATGPATALPLEGVKVLSLEHFIAMPAATNILAALGAEVIKIEPLDGEQGRHSLPLVESADGVRHGSAYIRYSRGKSSIAVDLKQPEGIALIKQLAAHVDVFAENMRAGKTTALGLGPEALAEVNPDLIYASVSGYGNEDGSPYGTWPAFAPAAEALAGLPYLAGDADGTPRANTFGAAIDIVGGMNAVIGILAALQGRRRNGKGYRIDIALVDTALALNEHRVHLASLGLSPDLARSDKNGIVTLFRASDGDYLVAAFRHEQFARLARLVGADSWIGDPRFAERSEWSTHLEDVVRPVVERWSAELTSLQAATALGAVGVAAAPSLEAHKLLDDPHVEARHMLSSVDGLDDAVRVVSSPVRIIGVDDTRTTLVPVGHDTKRILEQIGFTDDMVVQLQKDGVISAGL